MYQVIKEFHDLQDVTETKSGLIYHKYSVGDTYPRQGQNPSDGRIAELAGADNAQGQPLIRAMVAPPVQEPDPDQDVPAPAEEAPTEDEQNEKPATTRKKASASKKATASE